MLLAACARHTSLLQRAPLALLVPVPKNTDHVPPFVVDRLVVVQAAFFDHIDDELLFSIGLADELRARVTALQLAHLDAAHGLADLLLEGLGVVHLFESFFSLIILFIMFTMAMVRLLPLLMIKTKSSDYFSISTKTTTSRIKLDCTVFYPFPYDSF